MRVSKIVVKTKDGKTYRIGRVRSSSVDHLLANKIKRMKGKESVTVTQYPIVDPIDPMYDTGAVADLHITY